MWKITLESSMECKHENLNNWKNIRNRKLLTDQNLYKKRGILLISIAGRWKVNICKINTQKRILFARNALVWLFELLPILLTTKSLLETVTLARGRREIVETFGNIVEDVDERTVSVVKVAFRWLIGMTGWATLPAFWGNKLLALLAVDVEFFASILLERCCNRDECWGKICCCCCKMKFLMKSSALLNGKALLSQLRCKLWRTVLASQSVSSSSSSSSLLLLLGSANKEIIMLGNVRNSFKVRIVLTHYRAITLLIHPQLSYTQSLLNMILSGTGCRGVYQFIREG